MTKYRSNFTANIFAVLSFGLLCFGTPGMADEAEQMLDKLKANSSIGYLQSGDNELRQMDSPNTGRARYLKFKDGLEILGNHITVYRDEAGNIAKVDDDSTANLKVGSKQPLLSAGQATNAAAETLTDVQTGGSDSRLVWFRKANQGLLAWQIDTELVDGGPASPTQVLTTVDANTGEILSQSVRGGNQPYFDPETGQEIIPVVGPITSPIVINDTAGTAAAQTFGSSFPAVCRTFQSSTTCSATLIAPNVLVSARHCNDAPGDTVRFGQDSNNPTFTTTIQSVSLPGGTGGNNDNDVSILVLNANVPASVATPMRLLDAGTQLIGVEGSFSGYGGQGVGSTGATGNSGSRWGGQNIVDGYGMAIGFPTGTNIFSADFDDGTATNNAFGDLNPLDMEAQIAPGDSGGPLLVTNAMGEHFIVGVASFVTGTSFGSGSFWAGTKLFRSQIEAFGADFVGLNNSPFLLNRNNTNDGATFHVASNWDPSATPNELSTLLFNNSAGQYDVRFNSDTGNRTVNNVFVESDDVRFTNPFDSTQRVLTVRDLLFVNSGGAFSAGGIKVTAPAAFISGDLTVGGAFLPGTVFETSSDLVLETGTLNVNDGNNATTADVITGGNAGVNSFSNVVIEDNGSEWNIAGELRVNNSNVTVRDAATLRSNSAMLENGSEVKVDGANSRWINTGDVTVSLASLQTSLDPQDGGTIRIEGNYSGGATNTALAPGTVELVGSFNPANAEGQQTGTVRFQGASLAMATTTNTNIQIASASDFDLIEVFFDAGGAEPNLTLDGHLNVELLGGFQLLAGQSFEILDYDTFGSVSGAFANAAEGDVVLTDNGFDLVVNYDLDGGQGSVTLVTVASDGNDPPVNDNFASTISAGAVPFTLNATNVDATTEAGEQQLDSTGATVWWFFNAPGDGTVTIDTFGSDFDTQLHIYDGFFGGAGPGDINPVANNNDAGGASQSEITFAVNAGACYEIRVGGFDNDGTGSAILAAQGNIVLNGTFEPAGGSIGDVNCDGLVNLLDVAPFVDVISNGQFNAKADINQDGVVNLLDVGPFVELLSGG